MSVYSSRNGHLELTSDQIPIAKRKKKRTRYLETDKA